MPSDKTTPVETKPIIVRDNTVPPAMGRMVEYVLSTSDSPVAMGELRPAMIVDVPEGAEDNGWTIDLLVFSRGGRDQMQLTHAATAKLDHDGAQGTWHWPPPRELVFRAHMEETVPVTQEELEDDIQKRLDAHIEKKGYAVSEAMRDADGKTPYEKASEEIAAAKAAHESKHPSTYPSKSPSAYPAPEAKKPSQLPPADK